MACSSLPPFKHILPRFKRLPNINRSIRRRNRIRQRLSILASFLTILVLSTCRRQQNNILRKSPSDRITTVTLHLAEAALRDFQHSRKFADRTTRFFSDDDANVRMLVDLCRIPPVFVSRLNPEGRRRLLGRLTRDSNGVLLWNVIPKILVIDLQNGLGNRLRALASAMEFAFITGRVLVVLWSPDAHISARIADLLDQEVLDNLIVIEQAIPWPINQNHTPKIANNSDLIPPITSKHPAASSFRYLNFMTKDDEFRSRSTRRVQNSWPMHLYIKTAYLIESHHLRHKLVNAFLQALTPSTRVMQLVHSVEARVGGRHALRGMIGVHLRSRTIVNDNDAVDYECEYSVEGAQTTDKWRKMSSPKHFIPEMKRVQREWADIVQKSSGLEAMPDWSAQRSIAVANSDGDPGEITPVDVTQSPKFFVCVDSINSLDVLAGYFPRDKLVTLPRKCDDRGPECIIYAFADMVLLSRTGAMIVSGWSSFSEVALRMRERRHGVHPSSNEGYHVRASGYDFGKPSRWEKLIRRLRQFFEGMVRGRYSEDGMTQKERLELCRQRHFSGMRR